jgi:hypothetical protein
MSEKKTAEDCINKVIEVFDDAVKNAKAKRDVTFNLFEELTKLKAMLNEAEASIHIKDSLIRDARNQVTFIEAMASAMLALGKTTEMLEGKEE